MITSLSTDFLIRLKNGSLSGVKYVSAPNSKFIRNLADLLKTNGYIEGYQVSEDSKTLKVELSYVDDQPKISSVKLFSKPGRRMYAKSISLPWGQFHDSLIIVSTSNGVKTQRQASKAGIGGEIIAEIN